MRWSPELSCFPIFSFELSRCLESELDSQSFKAMGSGTALKFSLLVKLVKGSDGL